MTEETYTTLTGHTTIFPYVQRPTGEATQYAALDCISEDTSGDHFTFGSRVPDPQAGPILEGKRIVHPGNAGGMSGVITGARLHTSAAHATVLPDIDLYLFRTDIADVADNAAFAPTDAEQATLIGIIEFSTFKKLLVTAGAAGNASCVLSGLDMQFMLADQYFMYGQMVVQNTYTPVSGEIFTCELDIKRFGH